MPVVYAFRLRDPWQCTQRGGVVEWSRRFQRPPNLAPGETLRLSFAGLPVDAAVVVNDELLERTPDLGTDAAFGPLPNVVERGNLVVLRVPGPVSAAGQFPYAAELQIVSAD